MYEHVGQKLAKGETIILDGATGTEIQVRNVPMDDEVWCAMANLTHPEVVRMVHAEYIWAGADVITANTFATSPLLFNALGRDSEVVEIDRVAVRLARETAKAAGYPKVAIAGSFSTMRPVPKGGDRSDYSYRWTQRQAAPLMRAKAEGFAESGCDLIIMEMMRDCEYGLWATEAAVATGLPVWVGITVERDRDGRLIGLGHPQWPLEEIVSVLMATGAEACLVMHCAIDAVADSIQIIKSRWAGPVGAYPESGYFKMPDWQFVNIIPAPKFVVECHRWQRLGATILGGCCGIGPEHIQALAKAFKPQEAMK